MPASTPISDLDVETVAAGLRDGSMVVVDVREPPEWARGIIPGSILMPLSQFDAGSLPAAENRRIVFSCAAGMRSRIAIEASRNAGLDLHEHFVGGFKGWVAAGHPVDPGPA